MIILGYYYIMALINFPHKFLYSAAQVNCADGWYKMVYNVHAVELVDCTRIILISYSV